MNGPGAGGAEHRGYRPVVVIHLYWYNALEAFP
jgi:hypothetical protein